MFSLSRASYILNKEFKSLTNMDLPIPSFQKGFCFRTKVKELGRQIFANNPEIASIQTFSIHAWCTGTSVQHPKVLTYFQFVCLFTRGYPLVSGSLWGVPPGLWSQVFSGGYPLVSGSLQGVPQLGPRTGLPNGQGYPLPLARTRTWVPPPPDRTRPGKIR